jgi:hypothetical protein
MGPKKKSIQPAITSMGFPLLQKPTDTCMGNIENEDGKDCGVERKLVHPRQAVGACLGVSRAFTRETNEKKKKRKTKN